MVLNAELINSDRTGVYACADPADFSNYSLHRPSLNTMIGTSKHQKRRVNETIILPRSKTVQVHCSIGCASTSTCTNVRTLYMHVHTIVMVRTDDIRTERVNEEILLGRTLIPFISSCTIMLVMTCIIMYCRTDMHQDYSEEISIPPKEKAYFHAKLQVLLWSYFFNPRNVRMYSIRMYVLLEMMISVLQEVEGLTIIQ